ncbi:MAG: hypothetical protein CR975_05145 [Gammaproteobacteria bacterium]|nr:MAG: hypothetical protein CR975_05145 [Gammaproteobacteria bacterium]
MEHFELDRTDEEREELVKQWIKDYWLMLVIVVLGAIGAVYGLNYFKQAKLNALNEVANKTQLVGKNLQEGKINAAQTLVTALQTNEKDSSFSTLATLSLAQTYFNDKDYNQAIRQYDWLIAQSGDMAMRDLARLRKARVQADAKQTQAAVETLNAVEDKTYLPNAYLLKADILLADKQFAEAQKAYQAIPKNQQINQNLIDQRLELLNIMQQQ